MELGSKRMNSGIETGFAEANPEKSTIPMKSAATYPTTRPNNTESCLVLPFAIIWNTKHEMSAMLPSAIFCGEPKSGEPEPPPNDAAPTESSEKPMDVTTTAATIGEMSQRQYFANRPSTPSIKPPTIMAPIAALKP